MEGPENDESRKQSAIWEEKMLELPVVKYAESVGRMAAKGMYGTDKEILKELEERGICHDGKVILRDI